METPTTRITENDKMSKSIKFDKTKFYEIELNNEKYIFKISNNENIMLFEVEEINKFPKQEFNIYLNLEELRKLNKFFLQFDSLNEVSESIKKIIDNNALKIEKKSKEMILKFINPINSESLNIILSLKEKDVKAEINSLNSYIVKLNEKIENLEQKVDFLEKKLNENDNKFIEIFNYMKNHESCLNINKRYENNNKIEQQISDEELARQLQKELNELNVDNNYNLETSNIVKKNEIELILSWLEEKPKKFELLLDSKKDGDLTSTFYNKCKNKSPTIVFIETTKGYRFGGYTSKIWKKGYDCDNKSFVFSLDLKSKYNCKNNNWAIYYTEEYSFFFFGNNIYIKNNCTKHTNNYLNDPDSYDIPEKHELNGGDNYFQVKSYELYEIQY